MANHDALSYDYLIVGLGFESEDFGIPGVQENALAMDSVESAQRIYQHIEDEMHGGFTAKTNDPRHLQHCVAGAGFTGVELLGALSEQRDKHAEIAGLRQTKFKLKRLNGAQRPFEDVFSEKVG